MWALISGATFVDEKPYTESQKIIADEGDSINLTCTYKSNCELYVWWSKDKSNELDPVHHKKLGNYTRSFTYILKNVAKHFGRFSYSCLQSDRGESNYVTVKLNVKGKKKMEYIKYTTDLPKYAVNSCICVLV